MKPLEGILVVAIEQAVAAPVCSARLCEAGARVIKIERETGDFARGYDDVAGGDCAYFLWINCGKESLVLDFKNQDDAALLHRILEQADVLIQNLAPGALRRSGFGSETLREKYPQLITCDISGYGGNEAVAKMKAYDFLVQAESGLVSISGGINELGRVGVSICDISAGMNAHAGILEALLSRQKTGVGLGIEVSLFGSAADWMTVPLLHNDYGGKAPGRAGLHHPSIAPYGGYTCADDQTVIIAIQNEKEWARFCKQVLEQPEVAQDPRFNSNKNRVKNRPAMDEIILAVINSLIRSDAVQRLEIADIAFGSVNSIMDLSRHPALQRRTGLSSTGKPIEFPARPIQKNPGVRDDSPANAVPRLGQHSHSIRAEFCGQ
ncbi:CaiB/BaiF CoA transferase family protein [Candidatus Spongiihabitans sp.]|uniref:CaiB/BaiF CoA transferase family protein n=1 Tax=Candidatus Spongiihabitans sp. TaxID=3101308 RepID=UPI003C7A3F44